MATSTMTKTIYKIIDGTSPCVMAAYSYMRLSQETAQQDDPPLQYEALLSISLPAFERYVIVYWIDEIDTLINQSIVIVTYGRAPFVHRVVVLLVDVASSVQTLNYF